MIRFPTEEEEKRVMEQRLNANHRRVLTLTLHRLELATQRLEEQLVQEHPPQLALTNFTQIPSAHQQRLLLHLLAQLKQEIASFAAEYALAAQQHSQQRSIMAEFTLLWCDLEDLRPQKLRDYGMLAPQVDAVLNPRIQRFIDLALAVVNTASKAEQEVP